MAQAKRKEFQGGCSNKKHHQHWGIPLVAAALYSTTSPGPLVQMSIGVLILS